MDRTLPIPGNEHPITIELSGLHVVVRSGELVVADTRRPLILREAGHLPVYYVPLADVDQTLLRSSATTTYCPYKGDASYFSVAGPDGGIEDAAWTYPEPYAPVDAIAGHIAFYTDRMQLTAADR
ncbi:DUF427 domain-containing protein [Kutzneria buriramensis]|uniref:Uncharacterized protein (DUF427 family) n=1 Tax=Kutzneria buriramensis TaxID=1045776 RepID=A0A3E0G5J9_9PSEU|nr:DUF427 domain-containing protein [Kutzneria buriramensis]REH17858.1 uncharacterized protein (DUF427 family) [Kutzneria buriramensis]